MTASIDIDGTVKDLWWEVAAPASPPDGAAIGDALVAATLLVAMLGGHDLRVEAPVSAQVLAGADVVGEVFATWSRRRQLERGDGPGYRRVHLEVAGERQPTHRPSGVAAMFSAGVDSFHTVLRHRHRLDALVYVIGFDVRLGDPALPGVLELVRSSAGLLGLPLIEVRTNLRNVLDALVPWDDLHGAALAGVALLLGDRFAEVLVPATLTYDELYPLGSHPVLDPLWSSDAVTLVHDGAGDDRATKLGAIASMPAARRNLRVCFQFVDGVVNCGRCEKCLRTMVGARIAGVGGAFATLPKLRGPRRLLDVAQTHLLHRATTWEWYALLLRSEVHDPALRAAVGTARLRWRLRRWRERRRRADQARLLTRRHRRGRRQNSR